MKKLIYCSIALIALTYIYLKEEPKPSFEVNDYERVEFKKV